MTELSKVLGSAVCNAIWILRFSVSRVRLRCSLHKEIRFGDCSLLFQMCRFLHITKSLSSTVWKIFQLLCDTQLEHSTPRPQRQQKLQHVYAKAWAQCIICLANTSVVLGYCTGYLFLHSVIQYIIMCSSLQCAYCFSMFSCMNGLFLCKLVTQFVNDSLDWFENLYMLS